MNFFWSYAKKISEFTVINYGLLYNFPAVVDSRKITSSDDWVVPSTTQYSSLFTYMGGISVAGKKLRESGFVHWSNGTGYIEGTDNYGYKARGAGDRTWYDGAFESLTLTFAFWTSNSYDSVDAYWYFTTYRVEPIEGRISSKKFGLSVRLMYTGSGSPSEYVGNDGKHYQIITIDGKIYLADNLAETKYRNGDSIPEVTGNAAWVALTTGAMCAYNNNWANV